MCQGNTKQNSPCKNNCKGCPATIKVERLTNDKTKSVPRVTRFALEQGSGFFIGLLDGYSHINKRRSSSHQHAD